MKILVLGNGFDLDHDLPTSYSDFLNFCNSVLAMDITSDIAAVSKLKESQLTYFEQLRTNSNLKSKFLKLLKNNYLLNYFNAQRSKSGENWIDLEREIKSIIVEFKNVEFELSKSSQNKYFIDKHHKINSLLKELEMGSFADSALTVVKLAAIHKTLCTCLERFSCALELYIHLFINNTKIEGISPDIIEFDADKVLSFNYSNTYERVYGGIRWSQDVDHVHGYAQNVEREPSSIILGVTSTEEIDTKNYVEFEKYYQRITKRIDTNYSKWIATEIKKQSIKEVAFFGHSLDASDSDIINDLISIDKALITIFYFDDIAYRQIVANLIEVIGKRKLLAYVYGEHPKIKFVKQQKHRKENTAGLEITRDIKSLYRLHLLGDDEITALITKIKGKVDSKDLSYFYSQNKVISLFEALAHHNITSKKIEKFVEICSMLDYETSKEGKLIYHTSEYWYGCEPWGEEIECDKQTKALISKVNKNNKLRFEQRKMRIPYYDITQMTSSIEIKDALLNAFSETHPTEQYWNHLYELINQMIENKLLEGALDLIEQEKISRNIYFKFIHFYRSYWEAVHNVRYHRQMMEQYEEQKFYEDADDI